MIVRQQAVQPLTQRNPNSKGIALAIASYACYALATFIVKAAPASSLSIVFSRNLIGLLIFLPFFIWKRKDLKTGKLILHLVRASLSVAAMYCSASGIRYLNLGDAILLEQTTPLFIMIIFFIYKREKVSLISVMAILVAFTGVILILKPQFAIFQFHALASLGSGCLAGICFIAVERLMQTETPLTALFYFLLFSTLASAGPAFYQVSDLSFLVDWPYLLLIGLFFSLCQMLRSQALIYIDANVLGCYSYLTPVFSLILGVTFLEESFTCYRLLGSALILASGMSIYYEKRVRKNRALEKLLSDLNQ